MKAINKIGFNSISSAFHWLEYWMDSHKIPTILIWTNTTPALWGLTFLRGKNISKHIRPITWSKLKCSSVWQDAFKFRRKGNICGSEHQCLERSWKRSIPQACTAQLVHLLHLMKCNSFFNRYAGLMHTWTPPDGWCIMIRALGSECLMPGSPEASSRLAMLQACPTHHVAMGGKMYCIVS